MIETLIPSSQQEETHVTLFRSTKLNFRGPIRSAKFEGGTMVYRAML